MGDDMGRRKLLIIGLCTVPFSMAVALVLLQEVMVQAKHKGGVFIYILKIYVSHLFVRLLACPLYTKP